MLARESKILNLINQRNFIESHLMMIGEDGNPAYRYVGYLYPENRKYFEDEGYDVTIIMSNDMLVETIGFPVNIFTPREDISLSEDEEKISIVISNDIAAVQNSIGFSNSISDMIEDNIEENDEDYEEDLQE